MNFVIPILKYETMGIYIYTYIHMYLYTYCQKCYRAIWKFNDDNAKEMKFMKR